MINLEERSYQKELLDRDDIPFSDILVNLQELNKVNTLLGGHSITCKGVAFFLDKPEQNETLTIAEIGCGGGDNLLAVSKFLQRKKLPAHFIGLDIKAECVQYAQLQNIENTLWLHTDYRDTVWPDSKPDIIFSSLFCHHFTDEQLVEQLQWLKANSRLGFFINDLHRNSLAYYSIKVLTQLFSKSYLVKNDAALSVARGFKKKEWKRLLSAANISHANIQWEWAFRYLICVVND